MSVPERNEIVPHSFLSSIRLSAVVYTASAEGCPVTSLAMAPPNLWSPAYRVDRQERGENDQRQPGQPMRPEWTSLPQVEHASAE